MGFYQWQYNCFHTPPYILILSPAVYHQMPALGNSNEYVTWIGIICKNENEIFIKISNLIDEYLASGEISMNIKPERISNYTRKKQTQKLANLLDHI